MSMNHLIIGLGGTGGKVIKAFRKAVYEEFRAPEPCSPPNPDGSPGPPHPVNLSYLYVDSSSNDLNASKKWRTQGEIGASIRLAEFNRLSIEQSDLQTRLRDPEHYPVTHRYIGNRELWSDIFSQLNVQQAAGGQMRRLGTALFEPQCREFVSRVREIDRQLALDSGIQGVKFHVCCGLAGGTGSGAFLHIIAQLRANFPNATSYPIFLYLLLPDRDSRWAANGERTNYYANAYAALQELNAYLLIDPTDGPNRGGPLFAPYDLTGNSLRFENNAAGGRTRLLDRLQGCLVLYNVNERNKFIGVENEEIHDLTAQMVFQRIFLIEARGDDRYRALRDAITLENIVTIDEGSSTDPDLKVRSVRFLTMGLKRLIVPEEEIREHFTACFASQAALQMLFNNWPPEVGSTFLGEKKNTSLKLFVKEDEKRSWWKLTDDHITLSVGILDAEISNPRWRPISEYWQDQTPHIKEDVLNAPRDARHGSLLDDMEKEFQRCYQDTFRGLGVEKFYETVTRDINLPDRHVAQICENVERWMFDQWLEGNLSLAELEVFLDDLIEDLEERLNTIIPKRQEILRNQREKLSETLDKNSALYARTGPVGRLLKRDVNIFNDQAEVLTKFYENRSWHQAWTFALRLLQRVIPELRDRLKPEVAAFRTGLVSVNEFFQKIINRTCQDNNPSGTVEAAHVIKFYEPDKVRKLPGSLLAIEKEQRSWAGRLRREIVRTSEENKAEQNGLEKYFSMLVAHFIKTNDAERVFEEVSREHAEQAHNQKTNPQNRHIGVNVITKLAEKFNDTAKLNDYVDSLVQSSRTFMQWKDVEFAGSSGPNSILAVVLPECDANQTFRNQLATLFRQSFGGNIHIIDSSSRLNEICLIAFKYVFPLRYLEPVWYLKEGYDKRISSGTRERALLEVHIEDHKTELPPLFRPAPGEAGKQILPWLQLASVLNLFEKEMNRSTGEIERFLLLTDTQKMQKPYYYPDALIALFELPARSPEPVKALDNLLKQITQTQLEAARARVREILSEERFKMASEREAIKHSLRDSLENAVLQNRDNNRRDEIFLKVHESTYAAIEQIDAQR